MCEPARDAASLSAQWDNNALPLLPQRTARDHECDSIMKAGKMTSVAMWLATLGFLTLQGQNLCPVTCSIF